MEQIISGAPKITVRIIELAIPINENKKLN